MRTSTITRNTEETKINLMLNLDGKGESKIDTGCGFFDHMLTLFSKHSKIDLDVTCNGDTNVDYHHTVEDIGIVLGKAILEALGDKKGINRYADTILPMDESLILTAIDISGRSYLGFDALFPAQKIGDFDTELVEEFFMALVRSAEITLHIKKMAGENSHHIAEGIFKSFARSLRVAVALDENFKDQLPSTKGVL
ncbi:MAG: imidazoleglycerol-phosphate dehydratase HisB [Clostridia bacterium]|nr:imidazoleglycerol-phosphate dehydratase HisB [Clostridia bacterium]MBR3809272.1 imidazoleglycerol-phosphate dehydratase HisB [Clostridia bacterium]